MSQLERQHQLLTDPRREYPTAPLAREWVEIGVTQTIFPGNLAEARAQFSRFHAIGIAGILDTSLLATILRLCATSTFAPGQSAPGFREVESPQRAGRALNIAINRPALLRWLEEVTGRQPLHAIEGRVTQTLHRPGDELTWHDDILETEKRRLAIVINLSTHPYEGGEFALRYKRGESVFEHKYTELGSALIFAVDPALEHRVAPLSSGGPRRVFAGWAFEGDPA